MLRGCVAIRQRRIPQSGRACQSHPCRTWFCLFLAAAFSTGFFQFEAHGRSQTESLSPQQERNIPQEYPAKSAASASAPAGDRLRDHYLMLVNTAIANQMDASKMAQFDRSPYDGLAVSFADAYDTSPVLSRAPDAGADRRLEEIYGQGHLALGLSEPHGGRKRRRKGIHTPKSLTFRCFRDWIWTAMQARRAIFWKIGGTRCAWPGRHGVPGIVCDLEFYNNYKAYDVAELARMTSRPQRDVLILLRQVGARMADISSAEYPGASIWFLFTGFTRLERSGIDARPYALAATYIAEGLLDQIQRQHLPIRVLSGGEVGLGYCHTSVDDLRQAIEKRAAAFAPLLQKYNGILELAGTMTLWSDRSAKKSWVANGACGASSAATVEDLIPVHGTPVPVLPLQLALRLTKWRLSRLPVHKRAPLRCRNRPSESPRVRSGRWAPWALIFKMAGAEVFGFGNGSVFG